MGAREKVLQPVYFVSGRILSRTDILVCHFYSGGQESPPSKGNYPDERCAGCEAISILIYIRCFTYNILCSEELSK